MIDKAPEASVTSRALVTHARTLEFYRQFGIAEEAIARGVKFGGGISVPPRPVQPEDRSIHAITGTPIPLRYSNVGS